MHPSPPKGPQATSVPDSEQWKYSENPPVPAWTPLTRPGQPARADATAPVEGPQQPAGRFLGTLRWGSR
jgi:hypothetical protein